jgi:predicted alpha/beta hydrolase family esterase
MKKVMIIPGNGGKQINGSWFPQVKEDLIKLGLEVIATDMPDPVLARKKYWLPYIEETVDDDSILIGYSSGAAAALRHLENHTCSLLILIGLHHTHLDIESEKKSAYFDTPWEWDKIKENTKKIVIFASTDDPFIPIEQARMVKAALNAEYHEFTDQGHFGALKPKHSFPEIASIVEKFLTRS